MSEQPRTGIDEQELAAFLVEAKKATYAGNGTEVTPERPGFKELEYSQEKWNYRDSYVGFFSAPGQEVVRFQGKPVWIMSYSGGMRPLFNTNIVYAKEVFAFLKRCLLLIPEDSPFRGPKLHEEGDWKYTNNVQGDLSYFFGYESIFHQSELVFRQQYIGGAVREK
ncbi:MAG: DUF5680 domain-containing protein [archaeon]